MTDDRDSNSDSLPLPALERIERVCLEFEAAWKEGRNPQIENHLGTAQGAERSGLLRELLLLDLDYRDHSDAPPTEREYQNRFPQDSQLVGEVFAKVSTSVVAHETYPSSSTSAFHPPTLPCSFGDYELLEVLGEGGMGVVYRARQHMPNRIVALKIIRPVRLSAVLPEQREKALKRFRVEAQATAQLEHDHIVSVYDVGEMEGQPFFAMRYVDGRGLDSLLQDSPLAGRDAARLLEPVARALHYAHERDIIHRDIKPRNILVDGQEKPYVADFGLAKSFAAAQDVTQTAEAIGTPAYMSPEQAIGSAEIDRRTDVYSLGATLYELLTGRPPFRAATPAETQRQVIENEPVPPRQLNPAVDRDLETICLKCLEKDPRSRFATALDLADELKRFLECLPIRARPIARPQRLWRWCRRHPLDAALLIAVAVTLLAGIVVSSYFAVDAWRNKQIAGKRADAAVSAEKEQERLRQVAEGERDRAVRTAYTADIRFIDQAMNQGLHGRVETLLSSHIPQGDQEDPRDWAWYWLLDRSRSRTVEVGHYGLEIRQLRISPDRRWLAALDPRALRIWSVEQRTLVKEWTSYSWGLALAWSPDSSLLAVSDEDTLLVQDFAKGATQWNSEQVGDLVVSLAWSSDGKWIAGAHLPQQVRIWDVGSRNEFAAFEIPDPPHDVAWHPGGRELAVSCTKHLMIWSAEREQIVARKSFAGDEGPNGIAWHPSGTRIAFGMGHPEFYVGIWDLRKDTVLKLMGHPDEVWSVAWNADGSLLASAGHDRTIHIWDGDTGELVRVLDGHRRSVTGLCWSSDGQTLFSSDKEGRINAWAVRQPDSSNLVLGRHEEGVCRVKWSPDGTRVASSGWEPSVYVWGARRRQELFRFRHNGSRGVSSFAWSPDGRSLILSECVGSAPLTQLVRYDALLGERLDKFAEIPFLVDATDWSPDGRWIAVSGISPSVCVINASDGNLVHQLDSPSSRVMHLAWRHDSQLLAIVGHANLCQVWDAAEERLVSNILPPGAESNENVSWSPCGERLAIASSSGSIKVWNRARDQIERELWGHRGAVVSVDWSPDGRLLASGGRDGEVRIWSADSGDELLALRGHTPGLPMSVRAVAWSPNGECLVSGGWDCNVRLWDAARGYALARQEVIPWRVHMPTVGGAEPATQASLAELTTATTKSDLPEIPWKLVRTQLDGRLEIPVDKSDKSAKPAVAETYVLSDRDRHVQLVFLQSPPLELRMDGEMVAQTSTQADGICDRRFEFLVSAGCHRLIVHWNGLELPPAVHIYSIVESAPGAWFSFSDVPRDVPLADGTD